MNQTVKDALNKVNQIRNVLDMKSLDDLPKGERMDCQTCPIAKALNRDVSTETIFFTQDDNFKALTKIGLERNGTSYNFKLPIELKLFIKEFDLGYLEEYELYKSEIVNGRPIKVEEISDNQPFKFT